MKLQINKKSIILLYSYILCLIVLIGLYQFDLTENIFLYVIFFFSVILLNRILNEHQKSKSKYMRVIFAAEICFVIFLALMFILKDRYFVLYRLLITPAILLSIIQTIMARRMTKNSGVKID